MYLMVCIFIWRCHVVVEKISCLWAGLCSTANRSSITNININTFDQQLFAADAFPVRWQQLMRQQQVQPMCLNLDWLYYFFILPGMHMVEPNMCVENRIVKARTSPLPPENREHDSLETQIVVADLVAYADVQCSSKIIIILITYTSLSWAFSHYTHCGWLTNTIFLGNRFSAKVTIYV